MGVSRILIVLVAFVLATSCFTEPDCIVTASTAIKIDFKQIKINPTTLVRTVVDTTVNFVSVRVSGIDTAYVMKKKLSSLLLPVDPRVKSMKYILTIESTSGAITRKDSLTFSYVSESRVIAPKCGAYTYFLDLAIVNTNFANSNYKVLSNRLLKNTTNVQIVF